jgi:hypothetical protein
MTRDEIIAAWNAQADYMNTWQHLGEDEKLEWAMKLEREACARLIESRKTGADGLMEAVRDMEARAIRNRGQA